VIRVLYKNGGTSIVLHSPTPHPFLSTFEIHRNAAMGNGKWKLTQAGKWSRRSLKPTDNRRSLHGPCILQKKWDLAKRLGNEPLLPSFAFFNSCDKLFCVDFEKGATSAIISPPASVRVSAALPLPPLTANRCRIRWAADAPSRPFEDAHLRRTGSTPLWPGHLRSK
jgi:hypothetical protein